MRASGGNTTREPVPVLEWTYNQHGKSGRSCHFPCSTQIYFLLKTLSPYRTDHIAIEVSDEEKHEVSYLHLLIEIWVWLRGLCE